MADVLTHKMRKNSAIMACNDDLYIECMFVRHSNDTRFMDLKMTLHNANLFVKDHYPTTIENRL